MNRLQSVLVAIATTAVLLAIPVVHILARMDALPGGFYHDGDEGSKNPGQR